MHYLVLIGALPVSRMVDKLARYPLVYDVIELFEGFSAASLKASNLWGLIRVDGQKTWIIFLLLLVGELCSARSSEAEIRHLCVFLESSTKLLLTVGEVFRGVQDFL